MAARTPAWDVLAALRGRPGMLPSALAAADAAVHAHPKTPRRGFARALSRVKAVALRSVADESAAAVLQVLPAPPIPDLYRQKKGSLLRLQPRLARRRAPAVCARPLAIMPASRGVMHVRRANQADGAVLQVLLVPLACVPAKPARVLLVTAVHRCWRDTSLRNSDQAC